MTATTTTVQLLHADVTVGSPCEIVVRDPRSETAAWFEGIDAHERGALAADAWRIGLRAIATAVSESREARLGDVARDLRVTLTEAIERSVDTQRREVEGALRAFLDPRDGSFAQRLDRLVKDDGELAAVLRTHVGGDTSVLARTLAESVGDSSPLLKRLDPDQSAGVVQQISRALEEATAKHRQQVASALDPSVPSSPVSQFLERLRRELRDADQTREHQLKVVTQELDANNPTGLLNQLLQRTTTAQSELLRAVNLDNVDAPLARIQASLRALVDEQARRSDEALQGLKRTTETFQAEMRAVMERIETRREERASAPVGGHEFEDVALDRVFAFASAVGAVCEACGRTMGSKGKKGDGVLSLPADSAFAGASVVVEIKHDRSFTVKKALAELEEARENREAQVGLFLLAASHAPAGFPTFARHGRDILVQWDPADPTLDAMLRASVSLAFALVARVQQADDAGDADLADLEHALDVELERLEAMKGLVDKIQKDARKLSALVQSGTEALADLSTRARRVLDAHASGHPAREAAVDVSPTA